MGQLTQIEWTDATWNPTRGCSRVSEGCRNCYAEHVAARFDGPGLPYEGLTRDGKWNGTIRVIEKHIEDPLRWRKPMRIFVDSMSDLFHENVSDETLHRIYEVMERATQHTFQILTKRPERMRAYLSWRYGPSDNSPHGRIPSRHIWHGVSIEDQKSADARIPLLLDTPSAVRFLSIEPLIGLVNLTIRYQDEDAEIEWNVLAGESIVVNSDSPSALDMDLPRVDWVIVGGESGQGARPMHPDWARSLRDQCSAAAVPFFFKQWGAWRPATDEDVDQAGHVGATLGVDRGGQFHSIQDLIDGNVPEGTVAMRRVGKKAAGRLLDGELWDEFPGVGGVHPYQRQSASADTPSPGGVR